MSESSLARAHQKICGLASHFPVGSRVELRDLKSKPELNGQWGVVMGFVATWAHRCGWTVSPDPVG